MACTRDEALNRIAEQAKFTALPEVLGRLLKLFEDPETAATEVAEVVSKDAGLVARLLKIANSAYYGGTGNVATVQQAIIKIGFRTTKAVVLSSGVYHSLTSGAKGIDLRPFWRHGLEVAVGAMLIAEETCPKYSEEAFVAGLLHDMGRVAYALAFPKEFEQMLGSAEDSWTYEEECARFGVDHAEVGAFLAARWNFPQLLQDAIGNHHEVPDTRPEEDRDLVSLCVGLSDSISASSWAGPAAARSECRERRQTLTAILDIDPMQLDSIGNQVASQVTEWAELLEMELGDPIHLLSEANTRLFELYRAMDELNRENERLHSQLIAEERERAALEALRVICATFSHHINNATTTILGRAQLVNLALSRGEAEGVSEKIGQSMKVIENAVDTITGVLGELKCLTRFDTISYHGRSNIIKLKREISAETSES